MDLDVDLEPVPADDVEGEEEQVYEEEEEPGPAVMTNAQAETCAGDRVVGNSEFSFGRRGFRRGGGEDVHDFLFKAPMHFAGGRHRAQRRVAVH
eukprot:Skav205105  [mRNA]  locus=scaffold2918:186785:189651:- [translate_table: standard]